MPPKNTLATLFYKYVRFLYFNKTKNQTNIFIGIVTNQILNLLACFKDTMPVSFRSEWFTSYILTIFKQ